QLTPAEYFQRFPSYGEELAKRLRAPAQQQGPATSRLSCPQCRHPIAVEAKGGETAVTCPSCGSSFRLEPERPPAGSLKDLTRLDQFELLEVIGQGAFGTVYRARDTDLDRIVAVKVPRGGRWLTPADTDRFAREARSAAQLAHPGIVPVYAVGRGAAM